VASGERQSNSAFALCCILAATLVVISAVQQRLPDADDYRVYAENYAAAIFNNGPTPDAYRPPFYPIILAPIVRFAPSPNVWITLLHVFLTLATLFAVWRIARRTGMTSIAALPGLLVAVDPILVFQSGQIMTETIFTAIVVWTLLPWLHDQPKSIRTTAANGLLAGIGFLTRPTMGPIFLAIGLAFVLSRRWNDFRRWLIALAVFLAIVGGWTLRGWMRNGEIVVATTHGGYTLWLANNPSFYETEVAGGRNWAGSPEFNAWQNENAERTAGQIESSKDRFFRELAMEWIRNNPDAARRAALYRLSSFWGLQPRSGPSTLRPVVAVYFGVFSLLALHGWILIKGWRGPWLTATLVVLALSAVHAIYWSNMRFRAPIEPLLAILAAKSIEYLWRIAKPAT
jgi:4-amino-4-deoxy-L-arabinose transferase-like glycosyltransferase